MSYWPDTIVETELRTPAEIMREAGDELSNRMSMLSVTIKDERLTDRDCKSFRILHLVTTAELNLFSVYHQIDHPYPAQISAPEIKIPEYLQKQKYVPGTPGLAESLSSHHFRNMLAHTGTPGKWVEDEWVCTSPKEFSDKLKKLLASQGVTYQVLSFAASKRVTATAELPIEHQSDSQSPPPD